MEENQSCAFVNMWNISFSTPGLLASDGSCFAAKLTWIEPLNVDVIIYQMESHENSAKHSKSCHTMCQLFSLLRPRVWYCSHHIENLNSITTCYACEAITLSFHFDLFEHINQLYASILQWNLFMKINLSLARFYRSSLWMENGVGWGGKK